MLPNTFDISGGFVVVAYFVVALFVNVFFLALKNGNFSLRSQETHGNTFKVRIAAAIFHLMITLPSVCSR
jgi:hypothetical protein